MLWHRKSTQYRIFLDVSNIFLYLCIFFIVSNKPINIDAMNQYETLPLLPLLKYTVPHAVTSWVLWLVYIGCYSTLFLCYIYFFLVCLRVIVLAILSSKPIGSDALNACDHMPLLPLLNTMTKNPKSFGEVNEQRTRVDIQSWLDLLITMKPHVDS